MKPEIKKLWLDALRSGKYVQGEGYLEADGKHCCLGVLCELAVDAGIVKKISGNQFGSLYDDGMEHLPECVMTWSGIKTHDGWFEIGKDRFTSLTFVNDETLDRDKPDYSNVIPYIEKYF